MVPAFKKGHNSKLSEERKYFNTKQPKVWIKSEHCIGLLKVRFQHLQGHRRVIRSKHDIDVILQRTMCMHIAQHSDQPCHPQDWMVDSNNSELDEEEKLDHHSEMGKRCNQIFAKSQIKLKP